DHDESVEAFFLDTRPERHAQRHRQPVAERTRAHFHAGHLDVRMHAERGLESVELVEDRILDETGLREHGAERRVRMALRQDETVPVRPFGLVRPDLQTVKIKRRENVGGGTGTPDVPATSGTHSAPGIAPHLPGPNLQALDERISRFAHGLPARLWTAPLRMAVLMRRDGSGKW